MSTRRQTSPLRNLRQKCGGSCTSDDDLPEVKLITQPINGLHYIRNRLRPPKSRNGIYYSTDWDKSALVSNFQKRGWLQVPSFNGEWNFYWACTQNCRYIFGIDHPYRMRSDQ